MKEELILSICKLSPDMFIHGVTPINNMFITEFLPSAPSDFVKVYVYAFMQCLHQCQNQDLKSLSEDLNLEPQIVTNAFNYWERRGLLRLCGSTYEFLPMETAINSTPATTTNSLNKYKSFNEKLQAIMPNRLLLPDDYLSAYDWIEALNMSEECVLLMISYCVNTKYKSGTKVSFTNLNKEATKWVAKGIKTATLAQEYISHLALTNSRAKSLLQHLGMLRNPTMDEYNLYLKWINDWGFDYDAIITCCGEMIYSKNPNFALLDAILEKHKDIGAHTKSDVERDMKKSKDKHTEYKTILSRIGITGTPAPAQKAMIDSFLDLGYTIQGMLYVCDYCANQSKGNLKTVSDQVATLYENGIIQENQIAQYYDDMEKYFNGMTKVLRLAGLKRIPSNNDVTWYKSQLDVFTPAMLEYAGSLSNDAPNKQSALNSTLDTWQKNNITTLDKAREFKLPSHKEQKANPALNYPMRDDSNTDFDDKSLYTKF